VSHFLFSSSNCICNRKGIFGKEDTGARECGWYEYSCDVGVPCLKYLHTWR
jgi:hypothetical protein